MNHVRRITLGQRKLWLDNTVEGTDVHTHKDELRDQRRDSLQFTNNLRLYFGHASVYKQKDRSCKPLGQWKRPSVEVRPY